MELRESTTQPLKTALRRVPIAASFGDNAEEICRGEKGNAHEGLPPVFPVPSLHRTDHPSSLAAVSASSALWGSIRKPCGLCPLVPGQELSMVSAWDLRELRVEFASDLQRQEENGREPRLDSRPPRGYYSPNLTSHGLTSMRKKRIPHLMFVSHSLPKFVPSPHACGRNRPPSSLCPSLQLPSTAGSYSH